MLLTFWCLFHQSSSVIGIIKSLKINYANYEMDRANMSTNMFHVFFLSFLLECMCLWPSQATMPQCSPQALKLYKERKIVKIHLHLTSHSAITFVLVYHLQVIHNFHIPLSQLWPAIVTHFCLSPQLQIVYHNWVPYDIVWITHTLSLLFSLFNSNLKRQQKKRTEGGSIP
jgi:hypothetical protein